MWLGYFHGGHGYVISGHAMGDGRADEQSTGVQEAQGGDHVGGGAGQASQRVWHAKSPLFTSCHQGNPKTPPFCAFDHQGMCWRLQCKNFIYN